MTPGDARVDSVERVSSETLSTIRFFIDALREDFGSKQEQQQQQQQPLPTKSPTIRLLLFAKLRERGLLERIRSIRHRASAELGWTTTTPQPQSRQTHDDEETNDRTSLWLEIVLPLTDLLANCYTFLDALPAMEETKDTTSSSIRGGARRKQKPKPTPPRGMLSIRNYTDVACLLEFLVGAFPTTTTEDRRLPKSIAGRIPRDALLWAAASCKNSNPFSSLVVVEATEHLARVVVLDRFRPMLLPRHVVDLYRSIFWIESSSATNANANHRYRRFDPDLYRVLGLSSSSLPSNVVQPKAVVALVDPTLRAMAYRTLLSSSSSNQWMSKRVSGLLTDLATQIDLRGLTAIVAVFVPSMDDSGAASQRLGRTLVAMANTKTKTKTPVTGKLCHNLLALLATVFPGSSESIPPRSMAVIQTAWAVLEHLSPTDREEHILRPWARCLSGNTPQRRLHETLLQFGSLCASLPPHSKSAVSILHTMILETRNGVTILDQILRIALLGNKLVMPAVRETTTTTPSSAISTDAEWTLLWLLQAMHTDDEDNGERFLQAWVLALGPTPWDMEGNRFGLLLEKNNDSVVETIRRQHPSADSFAEWVASTTQRAEWFVDHLLLVLAPSPNHNVNENENENENEASTTRLKGLPSRLFRYLLRTYVSADDETTSSSSLRLVTSILLPLLCEKCSQEQLLFGETQETASELLLLIRQVLSEASSGNSDNDDAERREFCNSIASILLSLLIAVLELGSTQRPLEEEELLQSFLPILDRFSSVEQRNDLHEAAAMADMAAYAMTLIACRKPVENETMKATTSDVRPLSRAQRLQQILKEAESDLRSTQPPIRARGMVSLGRLARGFSNSLSKEQTVPSLIVELNDDGSDHGDDDNDSVWTSEVLRLSMVALADTESYVYLAAVQTIVAVGDLHPREVLPQIASAIVLGELSTKQNAVPLTQEQVIKLAEALIFIIRRRAVTDEYVPIIMNLMLHGNGKQDSKEGTSTNYSKQTKIQQETEQYFASGIMEGDEQDVGLTKQEEWEERDIRLKTGGPVFDVEEAEIVRSLRISAISELLPTSSSAVLAPFVGTLVRLVVEALGLDSRSRAVARSAALLAREVYAKVLSESQELVEILESGDAMVGRSSVAAIPCSAALLAGGQEQVLLATLEKGGNLGRTSGVLDSSLMARCKEALALRNQAEENGIFEAAKLVLEEQRHLDELPSLFRDMVSADGTSGRDADVFRINPTQILE